MASVDEFSEGAGPFFAAITDACTAGGEGMASTPAANCGIGAQMIRGQFAGAKPPPHNTPPPQLSCSPGVTVAGPVAERPALPSAAAEDSFALECCESLTGSDPLPCPNENCVAPKKIATDKNSVRPRSKAQTPTGFSTDLHDSNGICPFRWRKQKI